MDVVCGLFVRGEFVLMGKRAPHLLRPELWEYPGGKVQTSDDTGDAFDFAIEVALRRELKEELGVDVIVGNRLCMHELSFEVDALVHLHEVHTNQEPTRVVEVNGTFYPNGAYHSELRWVEPEWAMKYLPLAPSAYLQYRHVMQRLK